MTDTEDSFGRARASTPARDLDVASVIRDTLAIARRNPAAIALTTALFGAAPTSLQLWLAGRTFHPAKGITIGEVLTPIVSGSTSIFFSALLEGVLAAMALADLRGRRLGFSGALAEALPRLPTLFAIGLLTTLAAGLGAMLLVIPGLIAAMTFSVAAQVGLDERLSPWQALKRSGRLTRGRRLRILGLFVCYALVVLVVEGAMVLLSGAGLEFFTNATVPQRAYIVPLITFLFRWMAPIGTTVVYLQLREITGMLRASELAAVFD